LVTIKKTDPISAEVKREPIRKSVCQCPTESDKGFSAHILVIDTS